MHLNLRIYWVILKDVILCQFSKYYTSNAKAYLEPGRILRWSFFPKVFSQIGAIVDVSLGSKFASAKLPWAQIKNVSSSFKMKQSAQFQRKYNVIYSLTKTANSLHLVLFSFFIFVSAKYLVVFKYKITSWRIKKVALIPNLINTLVKFKRFSCLQTITCVKDGTGYRLLIACFLYFWVFFHLHHKMNKISGENLLIKIRILNLLFCIWHWKNLEVY